jgi:acyl dehydratase
MPVLRTPAFLPLLASTLGLFRHVRRGLEDPSALPRIECSLPGGTLDPAWLKAYGDCVGLKAGAALPPLALQIAAAPLHMAILGDARFPFRALGLVHMSQRVTQTRAIPPEATFDLLAYSAGARWERRGMSFGLVTEARCDGELVWQGQTRALAPGKTLTTASPGQHGPNDGEALDPASARYEHGLHVPESTGRRYAAIAGDLNPIHQHALLARLFGFKRAIVHGTWTLARALALAELPRTEVFTLDATFRRPVELPSDILVRAWAGGPARSDSVQVASPDGARTYLSIRLTTSAPPGQGERNLGS